MREPRLITLASLCLFLVEAPRLLGQSPPTSPVYDLTADLMAPSKSTRRAARNRLQVEADEGLVPALVDALFFTPRHARNELLDVLEALTGKRYRDYYDWVRFVGSQTNIEPTAGYLEWKRELLGRIDREYTKIFYPGAATEIRLEEIVWGGVPMAGIPALDDPPTMPGVTARYLRKGEMVFGLVVGDEARAYPLRILSWHELLNDQLGGEPITLSFCTLCGSGIFYHTRTPDGGSLEFDTSGLLYRSNKLMADRRTRTLWSNLTGSPVVGRLVDTAMPLQMLAGTLTTWEAWLDRNPTTSVLDLKAVERQMGGRYDFDYRPGAADRARRGVSFPVWLDSQALERDRQVFTLRLSGAAKAYPLDRLLERGLVLDEIGGKSVVLVADSRAGAVRAYLRGPHRFLLTEDGDLVDSTGRNWTAKETALMPFTLEGEDVAPLERLPGHVALWFGWFAFFPDTEVWDG